MAPNPKNVLTKFDDFEYFGGSIVTNHRMYFWRSKQVKKLEILCLILCLIQIFAAGWLGKGDEKLTKTLSESQSLPTSNLGDFENFVCSKWIDMLNNAWTGNS